MGWRRYSYHSQHSGSHVQSSSSESPTWVFRGCYWRWQTAKEFKTSSKEDETRYLEELRDFLQRQIKNVEERLEKLRNNP